MGEAKRVSTFRRLHGLEDRLAAQGIPVEINVADPDVPVDPTVRGGLNTLHELREAGLKVFPNLPQGAVLATTTCPTCGYVVAFTEGEPGQMRMKYPEEDAPCRHRAKIGDRPEALYCPDFNPAYVADMYKLMGNATRRNRLRRS